MIISYDREIEKQEFFAEARELKELGILVEDNGNYFKLGEVNHPVVALDKSKLSQMENGDLIKYLFVQSPNPVGTCYDDVNTFWFKLDGTWPATIESLVHLGGQRKSSALETAKTILDLGCGTGIAGNHAYKKNKNIEDIYFADINPNNVKVALLNSNTKNGIVSNGFENIKGKYDVILASAVPAMPLHPNWQRKINPLFEGTEFLESLLRDSVDYLNAGGKLILSSSSMAENVFQELSKKYGAKIEELDSREIAFREEFLQDKEQRDYLIGLGGLKYEERDGHKFWFDEFVRQVSFE